MLCVCVRVRVDVHVLTQSVPAELLNIYVRFLLNVGPVLLLHDNFFKK